MENLRSEQQVTGVERDGLPGGALGARLMGLLAAVLGLTAGLGLYTHSTLLIKFLPGLTAMVFNTAISFVALGIAVLALSEGRRRAAALVAAGVAALSLATLAEYVFGVSLGIDQLLVKADAGSLYPGRIAPNTAFCLLALSAAAVILSARSRSHQPARAAVMAALAIGVSVVSLVGYLTSFNTFGWGRFIPMAQYTAIGLVLLGVGLLAIAWREDRSAAGLPSWLYMVVTIAAAVMTFSSWRAVAANERSRVERAVEGTVSELKDDVAANMELRIAGLVRAARRWEYNGRPREQDRQFEAGMLLSDVPGYTAIFWVDPELHVRWVYPAESNSGLLGSFLGNDGKRRAALEVARVQRAPAVTSALALLGGGRGINVYVPIFRGQVFDGYIAGRFATPALFQAIMPPSLAHGYAVEILDETERLYTRSPQYDLRIPTWAREAAFSVGNTRWTLRVWPTTEALALVESNIPQVALAAGLLLSILLGGAIYLAQTGWLRARVTERLKEGLEQEVADRRRAEQELDQFFTLSLDMLCIAGFDGHFKRLNGAWTRSLGWSSDELMAQPYASFIHPDDVNPTLHAAQQQVQRGNNIVLLENRYRSKDGSYRWLRWNSTPSPGRRLIYAAARDVTAEKEAEAALRQARDELEERVRQRTAELEQTNQALYQRQEFFRRLFDDSPIGAAVVGLDHKINQANRAFCELVGYSASELAALTVGEITYPDDVAADTQSLRQITGGEGRSYHLTQRYVRKDGAVIWVESTTTAIRDRRGSMLAALSMVENVTERRLRDEQIALLHHELQQRIGQLTELNQELESFNYSISHDLRAPLRHLDGFSKILLEEHGPVLPADAKNCAGRIRDAARRMGRMVDELLELSRTSRREPEKQLTGLGSLVEDTLAEMQPELNGREIEWRIGELPFVECDPTLIRQVFANLLSNAVKFSRTRKPAVIEVGCTMAEGQPAMFVRDNGVGFNMKYSDKLFGVFQRLHRREDFEGTGVGLATVNRIVHKHGGRIWATAEVEKGATFYFTLEPGRPTPLESPSKTEPASELQLC